MLKARGLGDELLHGHIQQRPYKAQARCRNKEECLCCVESDFWLCCVALLPWVQAIHRASGLARGIGSIRPRRWIGKAMWNLGFTDVPLCWGIDVAVVGLQQQLQRLGRKIGLSGQGGQVAQPLGFATV